MRTYARETFLAARKAWADGEFGREWHEIYEIARDQGYIFPPAGTKWDDREEDKTQRSIVYQAMQDIPVKLREIMRSSHSWHEVTMKIMAYQGVLADQAELHEMDAEWEKRQVVSKDQSPVLLRSLLQRLNE